MSLFWGGGRGQGKFVPKFPLIYSKVWRRRRVIFFFSSAYTPCASKCRLIPFPCPDSIASLQVHVCVRCWTTAPGRGALASGGFLGAVSVGGGGGGGEAGGRGLVVLVASSMRRLKGERFLDVLRKGGGSAACRISQLQ